MRPGVFETSGQRLAIGEGVEKRGLPDVGAAGEGDLRRPERRQIVRLGVREYKFAGAREQQAPVFGEIAFNGISHGKSNAA